MNSEQISLYFNDKLIAMAFGELLSSLGFQAEAISSLDQLANAKKVITEPIFFESLSEDQKKQCLLVGNQYTSDKLGCPVIRQPLTPVKIQAGLQEFLGASVAH